MGFVEDHDCEKKKPWRAKRRPTASIPTTATQKRFGKKNSILSKQKSRKLLKISLSGWFRPIQKPRTKVHWKRRVNVFRPIWFCLSPASHHPSHYSQPIYLKSKPTHQLGLKAMKEVGTSSWKPWRSSSMRLEQAVESHEGISPPNELLDFVLKERKESGEEREARGTQTKEVGSHWVRVERG